MYELGVVHRTSPVRRATTWPLWRRSASAPSTRRWGGTGLMRPYIRPVYHGAAFCGTAVTVLLQPGDNWMLHVAVEQLQPGDVLVAACTTENEDGFFGELLATSRRSRGRRPRHRRRLPRRGRPGEDGLPRLQPGHQLQGHGEGDARFRQRAGRLRERAGPAGRRGRCRRRRRRRRPGGPGRMRWPRRAAGARRTRRTSGAGSPRANSASTCTRCAGR